MATLQKGTKITCPRKGHLIATVNTNVHTGDIISFKQFDFAPGQSRIAGEYPVCALCDSAYIIKNVLHTADGWVPHDPQLEPVSINKR